MKILALDLGTTTGWAVYDNGKITSGSKKFKEQSSDSVGRRFQRFRNWLIETKNRHGHFDFVYFEDVKQHAGTIAAHVYGAFWGQLLAFCDHHQIHCAGVGVGAIKKHATGKGNARKNEMIASANRKGFNVVDDNEADALALLSLAVGGIEEEKSDG